MLGIVLPLLAALVLGTAGWALIAGRVGPETPLLRHFTIRTSQALSSPENFHRVNREAGLMYAAMAVLSLAWLPPAWLAASTPEATVYGMAFYAVLFLGWYGVTVFRLRRVNQRISDETGDDS